MTASPVSYARHDDVGVITVANPPVNALSHAVRVGLVDAIAQAAADTEARAVVLVGAGRTFPAGADITEFARPLGPPDLNEINAALEALPKPVVAALHGTALGGGLELAMSCHYRIAVPSARVGLPEVTLGILPGAGGTQRLPRLIGLEPALEIITGGRPVTADRALALGLVDHLVEAEADVLEAAVAFARSVAGRERPVSSARRVPPDPDAIARTRDAVIAAQPHAFAPARCVDAVAAAAALPFAEGLVRERTLFEDCRQSPQSRALIHVFFAERQAAKVEGLPKDVQPRRIGSVAVVGAGPMGCAAAIACAAAGLPVTIIENDAGVLNRARARITDWFDARLPPEAAEATGRLVALEQSLSAAGQADVVIEAVGEDAATKRAVFADLPKHCRPSAILASTTALLDINALAEASGVAERVVGLNIIGPDPGVRLLEIRRGARTADDVLATALAFAKRVGRVPVVTRGPVAHAMAEAAAAEARRLGANAGAVRAALEAWGFTRLPFAVPDAGGEGPDAEVIQRRILSVLADEGRRLLEAGTVQRASDIDIAWTVGLGFPREKGGPMWWAGQEEAR
jgi:3-hydroxyacyl-CoA dehydrogenase